MLSRVLEVDPGPYDGLRAVLLGGGPIPDRLLHQAGAAGLPVLPTYGLTETAGQVATLKPDAPLENKAHPLPGVSLRIEPDQRIAVQGPMVSRGYVGEPDRDLEDWLVTGDLGRVDSEGALWVTGRADTIIISGGENIDPALVEAALAQVAGVDEALVAGVASETWGMETVCLYVGEANPAKVEAELRGLATRLHDPQALAPGRRAAQDANGQARSRRGRAALQLTRRAIKTPSRNGNAAASNAGSAATCRLNSSVPYPWSIHPEPMP